MNPFDQAMHEVLQRSQYDILTGRAIDYQRVIMEAMGRAIVSLLERVNVSMPGATAYDSVTIIFITVAIVLLLATVMGIVYLLLKHRGQKERQEASVSALFDDIANKKFSLADLLRISREYEDKRQFRDAIRHNYIAVLVALNEKRTIQVDKSKTNAQLSQELEMAAPGLYGAFVPLVEVFHQTWFGRKHIEEENYRRFAAYAEEILHESV